MTRSVLDTELQQLDEQIRHLGTLVNEALGQVLEVLETGDLAKSGLVIESDAIIDSLRAAIEEHTIRLLTLQQPLFGHDLRYLTSALSIASELERMGDGAEGIAQIILRMVPLQTSASPPTAHIGGTGTTHSSCTSNYITEQSARHSLIELGREVQRVLQGTIKAFTERNSKAAHYIWEEDDVVDVRYHLVRHELMAMMAGAHAIPALQQDAKVLQRVTYLLWIAHKLERIGDHCSNICERIVFIVDGEADPLQASHQQET
jgi:phosphate transport system protein